MVETTWQQHFVLVDGGAHGAWCWYRIVDLLQQAGHKVSAVDLASAGVNSTDSNTLTSAREYAAPLFSLLQALPDSEKVILVVHSMGGLIGSIAMEQFPEKIAVAVFVAALMFTDSTHERAGELAQLFGQVFAKLATEDAVEYFFKDGPGLPPTSGNPFWSTLSSSSTICRHRMSLQIDVALAKMCLKPFPLFSSGGPGFAEYFPPQTAERYGSVPRVYIESDSDQLSSPSLANLMCELRPPKQRLSVHADHSPFFSAPIDLLHQLLKIAATYT